MQDLDTVGQDHELDTAPETMEADTESQGSDEEPLEADSEEQDDESQDDAETEDEEGQEEEAASAGVKNQKTGNFDWKKINEKIGNAEVERAFKESQRQISRVSQENKQLREQTQILPEIQEKARQFEWFDNLVRSNPALRSQIQAVLSGGTPQSQMVQPGNGYPPGFQLPPDVNPADPIVPLLVQQHQQLQELVQQSQQAQMMRQQQQVQETFRQGLVEAKDRFKALVGRDITEPELRRVAEQMRATSHFKGSDWVPSVFVEEIQKATQRKFFASRSQKKSLPKSPQGGNASSKTAKQPSKWDAFSEAWDKEYGNRD